MTPRFNTAAFLADRWGDPDRLVAFLHVYGHDIARPAVNQWFRRGRLPTEWCATLFALLELENGAPISVTEYLT